MTFSEYCQTLVKNADAPVMEAFRENVKLSGGYELSAPQKFRYRWEDLPFYNELKRRFPLLEIAGKGEAFDKALNLMEWLSGHTEYNGSSPLPPSPPEEILRYSYDKGFEGAINCANKAIVLSDLLVAAHIPAMPVWLSNHMMDPHSDFFAQGWIHCVVHAYLCDRKRWVMLDPSFNSYVTDGTGVPLNLLEIFHGFTQGKQMQLGRYSLNGTDFFRERYLEDFLLPSLLILSLWKGNAQENRVFGFSQASVVPRNVRYIEWLNSLTSDDRFPEDSRRYIAESLSALQVISMGDLLLEPVSPE